MDAVLKVSLPSAFRYLQRLLPDVDEIVKFMESEGGWCRLPERIVGGMRTLNITNYAELYAGENAAPVVLMQGLLGAQGLREFADEMKDVGPKDLDEGFTAWTDEVADFDIDALWPKTEEEKLAALKAFEEMPPEKKAQAMGRLQLVGGALIAIFYDILAMMVHGVRLTRLVEQAKSGDDDAFVMAVQIDRNVLTGVPYFRERLADRQQNGEGCFYKN